MGRCLKHNAPLEYELIISAGGKEPPADLIEAISYSSINPYFKSRNFRRHLISYRMNGGCYQKDVRSSVAVDKKIKRLKHKAMV